MSSKENAFDTEVFARRRHSYDIVKELFRKSIHLCAGFLPVLMKYNAPLVKSLLCAALAGYVVTESLRRRGIEVPVVSTVTAVAARRRDENKFVLGPVTLVLGVLLASLLWPPYFAAVGIYALAFGDGLASLAGKLFGRIEIPFTSGKTAEGSLTCFLAILCATFLHTQNAPAALAIASVGMLAELLPLKDFDNILIPVLLGGFSMLILG